MEDFLEFDPSNDGMWEFLLGIVLKRRAQRILEGISGASYPHMSEEGRIGLTKELENTLTYMHVTFKAQKVEDKESSWAEARKAFKTQFGQ